MVAYLKAGLQVRTYSHYLRAAQEAEKEDSMELPRCPRARLLTMLQNCKLPVSSPCRNSRATSPPVTASGAVGTFGGRRHRKDEDKESNYPGGIEGVTEEFMVCLARAVKDAQAEEKCCYHCSSPEHFICNFPLIKTLRENAQLNGKEGMASKKEPRPLLQQSTHQRTSRWRLPRCKATTTDSLLES